MQIRAIAFHGSLVTGASQVVKIGLQILSVVVLARLLEPEDFGLIACVAPILTFVALFQNLGLQQAVVQRREIGDVQLNRIFWITVLIGLLCTIAIAAISPAISSFYGDARMTSIAIAASVPILFNSMAALPLSLMTRNLRFGHLAINEGVAAFAGFLTTVVAAYLGAGYWSLVIGPAILSAVTLGAAWRIAGWTPHRPDFGIDRDILSFGVHLSGSNLLTFFARNLDKILIGKFLGVAELGYYDRAYRLLLFPLENINAPLTRVMFPLLSRIQDDKARLRSVYLRTTALLMFAVIPAVAALTVTAEETVRLLLGERWLGVAPIFSWLGIAGLAQPLMNTGGWLFVSQGRTKDQFRLGIVYSLVIVGSFVVGLPWGATGVSAAYAICVILHLPFRWWFLARVGPVTFSDHVTLQVPYFFSAAATMLLINTIGLGQQLADFLRIALAVLVSYGLALIAITTSSRGRSTIKEIGLLVRSLFMRIGR